MIQKQNEEDEGRQKQKRDQELKSKDREKSTFLTGHRNFKRSERPERDNQEKEEIVLPQDEIDREKYLGLKLD